MLPDNIRGDSKDFNNDPVLSKQQIAKPLENMFSVFVTGQIIVSNMEI
jgi:hypothetical protein